jgi:hypothetical protein
VKSIAPIIPWIPVAWDPGELSWDDLTMIAEHDRSGSARLELQKAVLLGDAQDVQEEIRKFASAVGPLLKPKIKAPTRWIWLLGQVAIQFGGTDAPMLGVGLLAGMAGEEATVWALNKWRNRVISGRVVESAKTIGISISR